MDDIIREAENKMKKTIEFFTRELSNIRTGRANVAVLDGIKAEYYGSQMPINQVASVSVIEAKTIDIKPWDKTCLAEIEKSINAANLGLGIVNTGDSLKIQFPELTEETRKEMVKKVKKTGEELLQLVSFNLGDEEFGVEILRVQEINRVMDITKIPKSPDFVDGVINLRGKVIPVINLRRRFGLEEREDDKNTRIVVVEIDAKTIGFIVDAVSEVLRIPSSTIEPPPPLVAGGDGYEQSLPHAQMGSG